MDSATLTSVVEGLILASPEPLPGNKIADLLDGLTPSGVAKAVAALNERYAASGTSFRVRSIAGGYQFYIVPEFTGYVEELFARRKKLRLTRAALETLAIIAYKQPVTRVDVEHIRGVAADAVINNLLEKNMICIKGRAAGVGKPLQYGTTDEFLKFFGLDGLDDLPRMSEIEKLVSAAAEEAQTELRLEQLAGGATGTKLNVADGTFDPERRRRRDAVDATEPGGTDDESGRADDDLQDDVLDSIADPEEAIADFVSRDDA